jgi:hypothetical protein
MHGRRLLLLDARAPDWPTSADWQPTLEAQAWRKRGASVARHCARTSRLKGTAKCDCGGIKALSCSEYDLVGGFGGFRNFGIDTPD